MQTLQTPHLFTFLPSKTLTKPYTKPHNPPPKTHHLPCKTLAVKSSLSSDEFPVDETFLESFGPKEKESEDEARRRNWVERGWAPWEEILSPEALFARHSLNEGEEVPLQTPEAIEAFKMLSPKYRKKKMEEMGLTEDDYYAKQFEIKGDIPEPLDTTWAGPLVVRHVPPRDWPPRGWEVDRGELEFIREAHRLMAVRVDLEEVEKEAKTDTEGLCLDRYKVFLKQYNEWVAANKDRLEEESYKYDQDYYPGRRKRGKDYKEGMYELPFYYPGQICAGKVTTLHLYQGAFVDIGGVYEGWVPIKRNDWYWIRHHIKVGMHVIVEILAKRDPYRFRFPIEMHFVDPNIDHLIFNRFDFPPIFHRDEDTNPDEIRRDCRRPPIPIKDPGIKVEEEPLLSNHPYVDKNSSNHANMKTFSSGMPSLQKPIASSHRRLGRSLSQKDLSKLHDDYSGQSSVLTDDEANDARSSKNMIEKTIRAVYAQKKAEHPTGDDVNSGLFEAMRKELRYAVDEIKMELEHGMVRKTSALASESSLWADDSNVLQAVPKVRKKYTTKLEQSEKRKQDLLAEIALEEQHGRELSKIVRELLPDPKSSANAEKPSRARKRSNDKNRVSKRLTEEAEKYFEDFISNVEDTDLSSYDGERSDASSTLRVTKTRDAVLHSGETETFRTQTRSNYPPVEIMDGVILPWLQWETCNDGSALPSKNKRELPMTPQSISWDADQEAISAQHPSGNSASSRGSWSPGLDGPSSTGEGSILKEVASHQRSQFDMDRYLKLRREEDHLFERWKGQNRINSGGLLLCSSNAFF